MTSYRLGFVLVFLCLCINIGLTMKEFVKVGKEIGLSGKELLDFVREEGDKAEKRELERTEKAERKELERIEKEEKKELDKIEREREREDRLLEREMKKLELESIAREKELALEMERLRSGGVKTAPSVDLKARLPKLLPFNEKSDSMDAYLKRFERFAETAKWNRTVWATHLSALLQGKALYVYSRLSVDDALDYDHLRTALLKRFQLTEEGFRNKFRNSKAEVGETPLQFVVRLEDYLLRWMDLAKVPKDYVGLKDLILREQFMQASSKPLQVFLKERKVESAEQMAELAEQYQEAHGSQSFGSGRGVNSSNFGDGMKSATFSEYNHTQPEKVRTCYICRDSSHIAKNCPRRFGQERESVSGVEGENQRDGRFGGRPDYGGRGNSSSGYRGTGRGRGIGSNGFEGRDRPDSVSCFVEGRASVFSSDQSVTDSDQKLSLKRNCKLDNMPVAEGLVNGKKVSVLRDSGCPSAVVKRELVDSLSGKVQTCVLVDGTIRKFPVATVFIETPFYTGEIEALCAEYPVYDLIIGNIPGVKEPVDVRGDAGKCTTDTNGAYNIACTIIAQNVDEGIVSEVKVNDSVSGVSGKNLKKIQTEDETLDRHKESVTVGETKKRKSKGKTWFTRENRSGKTYQEEFTRVETQKVPIGKMPESHTSLLRVVVAVLAVCILLVYIQYTPQEITRMSIIEMSCCRTVNFGGKINVGRRKDIFGTHLLRRYVERDKVLAHVNYMTIEIDDRNEVAFRGGIDEGELDEDGIEVVNESSK